MCDIWRYLVVGVENATLALFMWTNQAMLVWLGMLLRTKEKVVRHLGQETGGCRLIIQVWSWSSDEQREDAGKDTKSHHGDIETFLMMLYSSKGCFCD